MSYVHAMKYCYWTIDDVPWCLADIFPRYSWKIALTIFMASFLFPTLFYSDVVAKSDNKSHSWGVGPAAAGQ